MISDNPYKGLFPYKDTDEPVFFGREKETKDLLEMIKTNKLVVLFGESGTGKTSLINAKLFPSLKKQYYYPIYIRINYSKQEVKPIIQVKREITRSLQKIDPSIVFEEGRTLLDSVANTSVVEGLIKPVLFLDQFEELFTLAPGKTHQQDIEIFINELSELIQTETISNKSTIRQIANNNDVSIEDINRNMIRFKVVFSLRQDFIAQLDDLKFKIPAIISNRYRIKKFNYLQAYEAIIEPVKVARKFANEQEDAPLLIEEKAAIRIIDTLGIKTFLTDDEITIIERTYQRKTFLQQTGESPVPFENVEIDPTVLSLYCYQLLEEFRDRQGQFKTINVEMVNDFPQQFIIKRYYTLKLKVYRFKVRYEIEKWLITPDGRRVLMPLQDFLDKSNLQEKEVLAIKNDTALLRIYGKGDERQIEIAHDQIAKRALASREARAAQRIRRIAVAIAAIVISIGVIIGFLFVSIEKRKVSVKKLESNIAAISQIMREQNAEIVSLHNTIKNQRDTLSKSYQSLTASQKDFLSKSYQLDALTKLLLTKDNSITSLRSEQKLLVDSVSRLNNWLHAASDQIESLNRINSQQKFQIDELNKANTTQVRSIKSKNETIDTLTADNARLKESNRSYLATISEQQSQISNLNNQLSTSKKTNDSLKRAYIHLMSQPEKSKDTDMLDSIKAQPLKN